MSVFGIFSDITCGPSCWYAKEESCRCECAGKNHGVLNTPGAEQPIRTAKIQGYRYNLIAVGKRNNLYDFVKRACQRDGYADIRPYGPRLAHYTWKETERGSPCRQLVATALQRANWPELSAYKDVPLYDQINVVLVWELAEKRPPKYCADECKDCASHKEKYQPKD